MPNSRRNRTALIESISVLVLILLYIWWLRFEQPSAWAGLLALLLLSHALRRETPHQLGFRTGGFEAALAQWFPALLLLVMGLYVLGTAFRTIREVTLESAFFSLVFYLFWGLFQQYVLNGYFVNRFGEFATPDRPRLTSLLAALAFSIAHTPNWFLMLVTFAGGYACGISYLKHRNLFFLGMAHGIVGFMLYLVVPDSISRHMYVGPRWFGAR